MTRRQTREAFGKIRLTDREKEQLLDRILSASSGTAPDGKDIAMKRRTMKPILIAAIVALMILLMGCAWAVMNLDDLVIGQHTYQEGGFVDEAGETIPPTEYTREVISLQGIEGTPSYQAAAEWYAYEQDYITNHWEKIDNFFERPKEYQAYGVGNQEMMDKVDEICEKYGLKLAGEIAITESWNVDVMFEHLGFDTLMRDESVETDDHGGYFYACGNFKHSFHFYLNGAESDWEAPVLVSLSYRDKEYLDTVYWTFDPADCRQLSYTCGDGTQVLIVTTGDVAKIMCDREDAFVSVHVFTVGYLDDGTEIRMTERDLELIAEAIDFTVKPQKPDMNAAKEALEEPEVEHFAAHVKNIFPSFEDCVAYHIAKLEDKAEEMFYLLADLNNDGEVELFLGSEDQIDSVWMMKDGKVKQVDEHGEEYEKVKEAWPTMEKRTITEYSIDSAVRDKYGYQRYVNELLSMEHPENSFFVLSDINSDGTLELLIGDKEQLCFVCRVEYDKDGYPSIGLLSWSMTEQEWNALTTEWLDMDKKPITAYYDE